MSAGDAEYVTRTDAGAWRIAGTRISLDSIVHAFWNGRLPEAIAADFPTLTLEQVYGGIAYYLKHRPEIDEYLARQDARWQQLQQESNLRNADLLDRIARSASQPSTSGHDM